MSPFKTKTESCSLPQQTCVIQIGGVRFSRCLPQSGAHVSLITSGASQTATNLRNRLVWPEPKQKRRPHGGQPALSLSDTIWQEMRAKPNACYPINHPSLTLDRVHIALLSHISICGLIHSSASLVGSFAILYAMHQSPPRAGVDPGFSWWGGGGCQTLKWE